MGGVGNQKTRSRVQSWWSVGEQGLGPGAVGWESELPGGGQPHARAGGGRAGCRAQAKADGACLSAVLTVGQAQAPSPPNGLGSPWLSLSLPPPHLHLTWWRGSRCSASWEHISP